MAEVSQSNVVEVTFIDLPAQRVTRIAVVVPVGLSGWDQRLTATCHEKAYDYGYTHWIQPYRQATVLPRWLVFNMLSARNRQFLKSFPNLVAAEMWVLHRD